MMVQRAFACVFMVAAFSTPLSASSCASESQPSQSQAGRATSLKDFQDKLRAEGATVERPEQSEITQPFFSVKGTLITVNDEDLQVFEYKSAAAAQGEARRINPDGTIVGTTQITWVSTPHFFRSGRLLVLYVGENATVLKALEAALGPRIAGGKN